MSKECSDTSDPVAYLHVQWNQQISFRTNKKKKPVTQPTSNFPPVNPRISSLKFNCKLFSTHFLPHLYIQQHPDFKIRSVMMCLKHYFAIYTFHDRMIIFSISFYKVSLPDKAFDENPSS